MLTVLQVGNSEENGQQLLLVAIYSFIIRYAVLVFDEMKSREDLFLTSSLGELFDLLILVKTAWISISLL